jgi:hypothetical protein
LPLLIERRIFLVSQRGRKYKEKEGAMPPFKESPRKVLAIAVITILFVCIVLPNMARAQKAREVKGLFCDSEKQYSAFIELIEAGATVSQAISQVNKDHGKIVCAHITFACTHVEEIRKVSIQIDGKDQKFAISRFTMIAVKLNDGNWRKITPITVYSGSIEKSPERGI